MDSNTKLLKNIAVLCCGIKKLLNLVFLQWTSESFFNFFLRRGGASGLFNTSCVKQARCCSLRFFMFKHFYSFILYDFILLFYIYMYFLIPWISLKHDFCIFCIRFVLTWVRQGPYKNHNNYLSTSVLHKHLLVFLSRISLPF